MDCQRLITARARGFDAGGIRRIFELASKIDHPVDLSIGQPHFDVPDPVKEAAARAIREGHNGYTLTRGIHTLLEAIRADFNAAYRRDGRWDDYGAIVTSGVSGGLLTAMLALAGPGDRVILPDPYFVMVKRFAQLAGADVAFADTYPDFQLTAQRVEPLITPRTKALFTCSPSNPTGAVTSAHQWRELVDLCESRGVLIVSDEIYDRFSYDQTPCPTPASYTDHALILRGFSKSWGMTGWRLGYALGPKPILDAMTQLQFFAYVCAPSIAQHAGITALSVDVTDRVAEYRRKRDRVVERLAQHYELTPPSGAFYAFPKAPRGMTGTRFAEEAIARKLVLLPGSNFSERDTHFRISYACDDDTLDRGLDLLVELAQGG